MYGGCSDSVLTSSSIKDRPGYDWAFSLDAALCVGVPTQADDMGVL